jgi:hypothetical protein
MFLISPSARVAELADALDLGSSGATRRGSNPLSRTTNLSYPRFIRYLSGNDRDITLPLVQSNLTGEGQIQGDAKADLWANQSGLNPSCINSLQETEK